MRWKIKLRWPYTKKVTNSSTASSPLPDQTTISSWNIYRSITELPLSLWISLTVDNNLFALVKNGNPPQHELLKAESDLRVQYADASGDHQYKMYCTLIKDIGHLELTLTQIESCINTLREAYHPYFAKELNRLLNTSFVFDVMNAEQYDKNLDRCLNRSKAIKINIGLKQVAYNALAEKYGKGGGKATREYYLGILITISENYPLSDNISVWEFCERIKRFNKKHEQPVKAKK